MNINFDVICFMSIVILDIFFIVDMDMGFGNVVNVVYFVL